MKHRSFPLFVDVYFKQFQIPLTFRVNNSSRINVISIGFRSQTFTWCARSLKSVPILIVFLFKFKIFKFFDKSIPFLIPLSNKMHCNTIMYRIFWSLEISVFEFSLNSETRKLSTFQFFVEYDCPRFDKRDQWPQITLALALFLWNIVCFHDGWRFKHANRRAMTKVEKGGDSGKQWA